MKRVAVSRRSLIGLCLLIFASAAFTSVAVAQSNRGGPPPAVTVVPVEVRDVTQSAEFIGRVEAVGAVDLRARVEGFLKERQFEEGDDVTAGTLLFLIEPDEYEARVDRAEADLARAEARLTEAARNLKRRQELRKRDAVAEASLDEAVQQELSAEADVKSAQADLRQAKLELSYTRITAPIDGRIGRANFTQGNLVGPDSGALARLIQIDPIRVVFSVADKQLLQAREDLAATNPAELNANFTPTLVLGDGSSYQHQGVIDFADNQIDSQTGTLAVWALFPNPTGTLLPGQLVNVRSRQNVPERRAVVPLAAVQTDRSGSFVLVVGEDNTVSERRIELDQATEEGVAVRSGVDAGEMVIIAGLQKVQPGTTVRTMIRQTDGTR